MPPARTGVADYSVSLLAALRSFGTIELSPARADVHLYHIANNVIHREIYERALAEPGIVVLHDALLQHLLMGTLDQSGYVREFVYNYGEWKRALAIELWRRKASSGLNPAYYQHPMLKRLVERSFAVIVHNPAAARIVSEHAPKTPVIEIPFLYTEPELPSTAESLRYRQQLCSAPYLFGIFGYLRESKRVTLALRAFQRVRMARPNTALLLAGDFVSTDLERAIRPWLRQPGVIRLGHLPEREFWRAAAATDACINLRYPTAAETSAIAVRLMGMGKPVIVSSGEEMTRYPESTCLRVDAGPAEEEMLEQYMLSLRHLSGMGTEIGRRAAEHIRRWHSIERVAKLYWETLCAHCQRA